jgi:hypothetical protein
MERHPQRDVRREPGRRGQREPAHDQRQRAQREGYAAWSPQRLPSHGDDDGGQGQARAKLKRKRKQLGK